MASVLSISALEEFGALRSLSSALLEAEDAGAASAAAAECLVASFGSDTSVSVWLGDRSRPLEAAWRGGDEDLASARERQRVLRSLRPAHVRIGDDRVVALLPLSRRGAAIGVLEVGAPGHLIDEAWDVLETVAGTLSLALSDVARQERFERPSVTETDGDLDLAISWTAHELRGPLSALRASLEFLRVHDASPEHGVLLDRCVVEIDHMSSLVDDVLRPGSGAEPPEGTDCDVVDVVSQAIEQCRVEFGVDRVTFRASPDIRASVEPAQLRSAVGNLVRNALAYSPARTRVEVSASIEDDLLAVSVRNAGRAVSGDDGDADAIFRPYVRGANAEGRFGTGLGLFIARRVAEANGGGLTLRLLEDATEFVLEIPVESR